ncbi:MAG: hypothetical protein ACK5RL_05435 [Acidimicrobiales bacterium]
MELAFVISALRRRIWLVTLCALLGALPGLRADPGASNSYSSTATLSIQAPTRANVNLFSADPDRYVVSQLAVLNNSVLREAVAEQVTEATDEEVGTGMLAEVVEIEQIPETDNVEITATTDDPALSQAIAQTYGESYVRGLATTDDDETARQDLDARIATLEGELAAVDAQLREAMTPYLPRANDPTPDPIPLPDVVDPGAVSRRQVISAELIQLKSNRVELDAESRLRVNTQIVAPAPLPAEPDMSRGNLLLVGGLIGGGLIGVVVALLWARFSTKVLDEGTASDIIGVPVTAELAHYRSIARNQLAAFQALPRSAVPVVDQLCVRAEAMAEINRSLTVLVTGTMRSAGATTLALAMAERFAAGGASVVLVDADVRDPRVTALFNATSDGGVPAVISGGVGAVDARGHSAFTRTMDPAVAVLGLGPNRGSAALRRDTVPDLLDACRRKAEIVVVDGGPVLDLASTIQVATLADAVVLAVPLTRQKADALGDLARQLEPVSRKLLPVVTTPARRSSGGELVRADGAIAAPGTGSTPVATQTIDRETAAAMAAKAPSGDTRPGSTAGSSGTVPSTPSSPSASPASSGTAPSSGLSPSSGSSPVAGSAATTSDSPSPPPEDSSSTNGSSSNGATGGDSPNGSSDG